MTKGISSISPTSNTPDVYSNTPQSSSRYEPIREYVSWVGLIISIFTSIFYGIGGIYSYFVNSSESHTSSISEGDNDLFKPDIWDLPIAEGQTKREAQRQYFVPYSGHSDC